MHVELNAIRYHQGSRAMFVAVPDPVALVKMVDPPDTWNPMGQQPHGNRPHDKAHSVGIREYLETEPDPIIGAAVLYAQPGDVRFVPFDGMDADDLGGAESTAGRLKIDIAAKFDTGDGQHRMHSFSQIINDEDTPEEVFKRIRAMGLPVIIVVDDNDRRRAQDYADLQVNVKPPTGSLGMSMDRRKPINKFMIELLNDSNIPLFDSGRRVEFLKDSPGKLSSKAFSFKAIRYVVGTTLIGVGQRSTKTWEAAANAAVANGNHDPALAGMKTLFSGLGDVPGWKEVIDGSLTMAEVRESTLLGSAGVLYALALAIHAAHVDHGLDYATIASRVAARIDFARPKRTPDPADPSTHLTAADSVFVGSLIDPATGKMGSGRPAWEAAGKDLTSIIVAP